jgi:hypothetical protein
MRKNGKSTKQANKAAKGKAKPAAPKSAAKKTAAPESKGIGRQGQIRECAKVKVFQRKLGSVESLLKALKLKKIVRLTAAGADKLCPRGPRVGLPSRRALVETVLSTATPAKPIRLSEIKALLTPLGVAGIGGEHFTSMMRAGVIGTQGSGYYATRLAQLAPAKGKPSKN